MYGLYLNGKLSEEDQADPRIFMPHEEVPETTFEEERMKALKKKSG